LTMKSFKGLQAHNKAVTGTKSAFTLIELLVVIAIIAILAAILFPVFAQAREKARQSSCLSNQKQIGLAVMQYIQDYDETFPRMKLAVTPAPRQSWATYTWQDAVGPYVKNGTISVTWASTNNTPVTLTAGGIWLCPSQPDGDARNIYGGTDTIFTEENYGNGSGPISPTTQAQITRPSEVVLISENNEIDSYDGIGDPRLSGDAYWQCGETWQCSGPNSGAKWDKDLTGNETDPWKWAQMPRYRHSGVSNFAFADGHVKAIAKGQLNWCKNLYFPGVGSAYSPSSQTWLFGAGNACAGFPQN